VRRDRHPALRLEVHGVQAGHLRHVRCSVVTTHIGAIHAFSVSQGHAPHSHCMSSRMSLCTASPFRLSSYGRMLLGDKLCTTRHYSLATRTETRPCAVTCAEPPVPPPQAVGAAQAAQEHGDGLEQDVAGLGRGLPVPGDLFTRSPPHKSTLRNVLLTGHRRLLSATHHREG